MAAEITVEEVKAVQSTSLPDSIIQGMIVAVNGADACLDRNDVPEETQKLLKTFAVAHLILLSEIGNVKSEKTPIGDSITYKDSNSSDPLQATAWGVQVSSLDKYGCLVSVLSGQKSVYLASVGPGGRNNSIYRGNRVR